MEQDKMRDEALEKIAEKWRDAAALGCVDALECALREAWQASREAVVVELPDCFETYGMCSESARIATECCQEAIHEAGIRTK